MYFQALATDFDGTIATSGTVDEPTLATLRRVRESGRKLLLVTGRELDDLFSTFTHAELFDVIVAENGGVLYDPRSRTTEALWEAPPQPLVEGLRSRNVQPLSIGRVLLATVHPHENAVLETIRELGLEYHLVFNRDAVMVLPPGVNKASGVAAALARLDVPTDHAVAIGDAENDHALLQTVGFGAAVGNALPALKGVADFVAGSDAGAGVAELVDRLLTHDLRGMKRHRRGTPIAINRLG